MKRLVPSMAFTLLFAACGGGGGPDAPAAPPAPPPSPQDAAAINGYLRALPAWTTPRVQNTDLRTLATGRVMVGTTPYQCTVSDSTLDASATTYQDIMLAGLDADVLHPGALLQGRGIERGQFSGVRLARAPITLTTTMNIDQPSITVANPTTAAMRDAIATLVRRGDTRTGAIDVTPGTVLFKRVEAHTFAQALNEVGVSAGYESRIGSRINSDFNFGTARAVNSHTVMVSLVQPLFKISFSEDAAGGPAGLLASGVTLEDLKQEAAQGRIGSDNQPVYVKSVTYGRIMMYTLTSTEVQSAQQLAVAVEGSYGGFAGSANYSQAQRDIIARSEKTLVSFGGPQEASLAAILDLKDYFVPMQPTQAVPISYELRDIDGNVATIGDITQFKAHRCDRKWDFSVFLSNADDDSWVRINGAEPSPWLSIFSGKGTGWVTGSATVFLNPHLKTAPNEPLNNLSIILKNGTCGRVNLSFRILANGETRHAVTWGFDDVPVFCRKDYQWNFELNRDTGEVKFLNKDFGDGGLIDR